MLKKQVKRTLEVTEDFLSDCHKKFHETPENLICRNAVSSVGSLLSTVNVSRVNEISHVFLNSVKKEHVHATNQGASGRCWMFAALNTFRHILINSLELKNFEFSEVYLFFWDKMERANTYLNWFINNPQYTIDDREFTYMLEDHMSDGGSWNTFANLVKKYGVVPLTAMKETFQSDASQDMNNIITEHLSSAVNYIQTHRGKMDVEKFRKKTMENIYNILVKFLGEPPQRFSWSFQTEECPATISRLTPKEFLDMVAPGIDMTEDFVVLANIPSPSGKRGEMKYYQTYEMRMTSNVEGGGNYKFFNVPIHEMSRYAMKSISNGCAVWFAGDVGKKFNPFYGALDDKLNDHELVFGKTEKFSKGDQLYMKNTRPSHAMALTGFNLGERGEPASWQVENSWGYYDKDVAGLDGFLYMSQSWFEKYVYEIVVSVKFLSRNFLKKVNSSKPILLNPWDSVSPALRVRGIPAPTFRPPLPRYT